jgi:hypothetical protein
MPTIKFEDILENCILPNCPEWDTWTTDDQIETLQEFIENIKKSEIREMDQFPCVMALHSEILRLTLVKVRETRLSHQRR